MKPNAMNCPEVRRELHAFLGGELSRPKIEAIQSHLEGCPDCRRDMAAIAALNDRAHEERAGSRTRAGAGLAARRGPPGRQRARWTWLWVTAAALIVAFFVLRTPAELTGEMERRLLAAPVHELQTFIEAGRPLDVASSDPEFLRQWFQGKIDFPLPAPPASLEAAELAGARLCYFLDRKVASFIYLDQGGILSLYVMDAADLPRLGEDGSPLANQEPQELEGFTQLVWHQSGLFYSLVSDLPRDRVIALAQELAGSGLGSKARP